MIYEGKIPCCGIFCGGCPNFIRNKSKCNGASINCEERKCGIYKCCFLKKEHSFCFECKIFPCSRFKQFAITWQKLGQDLIANQMLLQEIGEEEFLKQFNQE